MTRPAIRFPSATDAFVKHLRVRFDDLDETAEAHGRVPDTRPAAFVTVALIGGHRRDLVVDEVTVTVEAWADNDEAAHDLAQLTRAVLHATAGRVIEGVTIYRVEEFAGPANLPDPVSEQSRFVFTLSVAIRGDEL